jgi:hypothetical protein
LMVASIGHPRLQTSAPHTLKIWCTSMQLFYMLQPVLSAVLTNWWEPHTQFTDVLGHRVFTSVAYLPGCTVSL